MKKIFRARDFAPDARQDMEDELQSHRELEIDDLMARGMTEEEARSMAARELRTSDASQKRARAEAHTRTRLRRQGWLGKVDNLRRDLQFGLRGMARSPGFTIIAVLSLTIGIGANTAVFSVVNGLFLRPPPYAEVQELVQVWTGMPDTPPESDVQWAEFEGLQEVEGVFADVGAFDGLFTGVQDPDGTRTVFVESMTPNLFSLLGVEPVLGRPFLPDEGSDPGGNPLAILGNRYWMQAFGGSRDALGETLRIGGIPHTIVGVAPPDLSALQTRTIVTDIFVPMSMGPILAGRIGTDGAPVRRARNVAILARLAPGVSLDAAEARISGVVREVRAAEGRTTREGWGFRLWPLVDHAITPGVDAALVKLAGFLMAVAALVLLLACTNLASLLLARGVGRKKELALRLALGAGRGRLAGQLFTETVLLSALGGLGGFFLARWTLDLLFRFQPNVGVRFALDTSADLTVLLFTLAAATLASFMFGLVPALAVTRSEITPVLKGEAEGHKVRKQRIRGGLVALQMAVSVILLTGSSLFSHNLVEARKVDPGFDPEDAVSIQVDLGRSEVPPSRWTQVVAEIKREAESQAGIDVVGVSDALPLLNRTTESIEVPGMEVPEGERAPWASRYAIDHGYLAAMGIDLISGRGLEEADREGSERVVLVNQFAARRFWPGESALGREIRTGGEGYRVVGVVADVKIQFLRDPPEPTLYFSLPQRPASDLFFVARGGGETGEMLTSIRRVMLETEPNLLIKMAQSLEDRLGANLYPIRLAAWYLGSFGLLALLLAAIGLYGIVSLTVSRRTREVGIRMSIGADAGRVVAMVLRGSLRSVALGGIIGTILAVLLARLVQGFLFGVEAAGPAMLMAGPLILGSVAILAAFVPARRASRVDPVEALRRE